MSEIMQLRGRLATAEQTLSLLDVGIDTDIDEIRSLADKFEEKCDLKTNRIQLIAGRLHSQVEQYKKLTAQIKQLKSDLGE
ncbi:MAG TPA: hypothetical protein VHO70_12905 [Chitinispirillaceae bacterium]|nr:hypothetical protein [Chitinispirillaceae bacterium]